MQRPGLLLLALLLCLGGILVGTALVAGRATAWSLVRSSALGKAEALAQRVSEALEPAPRDRWQLAERIRSEAGSPSAESIVAFSFFDRESREVLSGASLDRLGLRGSIGAIPADASMLDAALHGQRWVRAERIDPQSGQVLLDVALPVERAGEVQGALVVEVNQSAPPALFGGTLGLVSGMMLCLLSIGIGVPTLTLWRRARLESAAQLPMHSLAQHDGPAELLNRAEFSARLAAALARSRRRGARVAVLCVDLDCFKDVTEIHGQETRDALLTGIAARLRQGVRASDATGRLGGDRLALLAEDLETSEDAVALARRIGQAVAEPQKVKGRVIACTASIGIAIGPDDGRNPSELLDHAQLALQRAKEESGNTFRFFEPELDRVLQERERIETELRRALQLGSFGIEYEPQYELYGGRLCGYEAVPRWTDPAGSEIPRSTFIPVAEKSGLMVSLGEWILRRSCQDAMAWPADLKLSVDLSPAQFRGHDLAETVSRILRDTGLAPERLELEVTEALLLADAGTILPQLRRLDALGVSIAVDDFGRSYSGLSCLASFPFSRIKIDRGFIDGLGKDAGSAAVVHSIISLGRLINVEIAAQGVSTDDQVRLLRGYGCREAQGVLFGPDSRTMGVPAVRAPDCPGAPEPLLA